MKKIYGLTGNIGCGKSTVASLLGRMLGVHYIDCDTLAKRVISDNLNSLDIRKILGDEIFSSNRVDLTQIAEIIFSNDAKRKAFEELVHPLVWSSLDIEIHSIEALIYIVESAIIFETGSESRFDGVIVTTCNPKTQLSRLKNLRGLSERDILMRLQHQLSQEEKVRRAQFVIDTNCDLETLAIRVSNLYKLLEEDSDETTQSGLRS